MQARFTQPLQLFYLLFAVKSFPTERAPIQPQQFQLLPVCFSLGNIFWSIKSYWTFFDVCFYLSLSHLLITYSDIDLAFAVNIDFMHLR